MAPPLKTPPLALGIFCHCCCSLIRKTDIVHYWGLCWPPYWCQPSPEHGRWDNGHESALGKKKKTTSACTPQGSAPIAMSRLRVWATLGRFQMLMSKQKNLNATAGNVAAEDSRRARPPQESAHIPRLPGPLDISFTEFFSIKENWQACMCRFSATF